MKKENNDLVKINSRQLYSDVKQLIDESRNIAAQTVNSVLSMLYWNIGSRINSEILKNGRAEYGKNVIAALNTKIVVSLIRQLSWTHIIALTPIDGES